ncbi:sel1 repeat family protein, partial [bacterium]|nr:sel1 repeat family protein [bacterium]
MRDSALSYYQASAELGNAWAQHNLGVMHAKGVGLGVGVAPDLNAALDWYLQAAEQGDALAQYAAGMLLHTGGEVPAD